MNPNVSAVIGALVGTVAFASVTGQGVRAAQAQSATTEQQVTITGCVEREADYRRTVGAGRGGAVGTGVGVGNEFVLTNAAMSTSGSTATATSGAGASTPTGTAGTATTSTAYELTGPNEGQAGAHVGKRVEITGKLKAAEAGAAGPTGGPTGSVIGSRDLKLRELEIASIRETTGSCTPTP